ncbi:MAG: hypothetical protein LBI39_01385 [Puniceicoccales bacterium]|nr:hypothetical protein [Puniceicoccales bacterium]
MALFVGDARLRGGGGADVDCPERFGGAAACFFDDCRRCCVTAESPSSPQLSRFDFSRRSVRRSKLSCVPNDFGCRGALGKIFRKLFHRLDFR